MKKIVLALSVLGLCNTSLTFAAEHEVGQKNKEFTIKELTIKVGDTVNFKNNDPFHHNIYSLSDIAIFDLGSYPKGESKGFKFDTAGEAEISCAIHPNMLMKVKVEEK